MDVRTRIERLLILHEGLKLRLYRCTAGKWSIGVGRNLDDNPLSPQEIAYLGRSDLSGGISEAEALWLLDRTLSIQSRELDEALPWSAGLDEVRRAVLLDMSYNLGTAGLLKFKNTLRHLQARQFEEAAEEMLRSVWALQVGKREGQRAWRLARMVKTGEWPYDLPKDTETSAAA